MGHAQVLRLASGHLAIQLGVAEQRRTHVVLADLGGLALGLQTAVAHEARPAGDLEGDDDPIPGRKVGDAGPDLLHDAHGLVTEDVAFRHERRQGFVQVQVRSAQSGAGDADDRVGRLLDDRVGNLLDPDVALSMPHGCLHGCLLSSSCRTRCESLGCPRSACSDLFSSIPVQALLSVPANLPYV